MAAQSSQDRFSSLTDGFNALTEEYQRLWIKSQTLERSLLSARDQVCRVFHCVISDPAFLSMMKKFSSRSVAVRSAEGFLIRL